MRIKKIAERRTIWGGGRLRRQRDAEDHGDGREQPQERGARRLDRLHLPGGAGAQQRRPGLGHGRHPARPGRATPSTARPARSSGRRASKATSWACGPGAAMIDCGSDFVIRAGPRGDLLRVVSASAPGPVLNSGGLYLHFSTQERHRGLLPRRGHESGLPLARGLERLAAGGLAARRVHCYPHIVLLLTPRVVSFSPPALIRSSQSTRPTREGLRRGGLALAEHTDL